MTTDKNVGNRRFDDLINYMMEFETPAPKIL